MQRRRFRIWERGRVSGHRAQLSLVDVNTRIVDSTPHPDFMEPFLRASLLCSKVFISGLLTPVRVYRRYSDQNRTSYRPTNEDCLMRVVTATNFCKACIEGLWLALLQDINLIDNTTQACVTADNGTFITLGVQLVPVGQFREAPSPTAETYEIMWQKDGRILESFTNKTSVRLDDSSDALGSYSVAVRFITEEVRVDPKERLRDAANFEVTKRCGA